MLSKLGSSSRPASSTAVLPLQQQQQRQCRCCARRGRKPQNTPEDAIMDAFEAAPEPAPKRRGRKAKTEVVPAPTEAQAPLTAETQPAAAAAEHERVVSIEDMMTSVELDYTDNPMLIVPSYTHQAQGHESATQPPLDNFVPYTDLPGVFVGSEELPQQQQQQQQQQQEPPLGLQTPFMRQQQDQQQVTQAALGPAQAMLGQPQQQQQWPLEQQQQQLPGVQVAQQQQLVGPEVGVVQEEDEDELMGYEEPPGLFDYEAGLKFAVIEQPPENPIEVIPRRLRAKTRREADYMLRYLNHLGELERTEREEAYKDRALYYHLKQREESHNVYLTGKALSVVMAEIELEDAQTGNRTDSFYPTWARAEHRWYPSGRFAAYNEYVKENLPDLTVKYAPGADQEEGFDIMDDVLLMADDVPGAAAAAADEDEAAGNPAAGLSIDSFMGQGMLPGAGSSELGQSYLDDVLAPAGDEEVEEELLD